MAQTYPLKTNEQEGNVMGDNHTYCKADNGQTTNGSQGSPAVPFRPSGKAKKILHK